VAYNRAAARAVTVDSRAKQHDVVVLTAATPLSAAAGATGTGATAASVATTGPGSGGAAVALSSTVAAVGAAVGACE
jgi:hypothetical protein